MEGELAKDLGSESIKLQGWCLSYSTLLNKNICNNNISLERSDHSCMYESTEEAY